MERMSIRKEPGFEERAERRRRLALRMRVSWFSSGLSAERASDVLWETIQRDFDALMRQDEDRIFESIVGPFMLLAAISFENYLKCICVSKHGAFDEKGRFRYGHHDLIELAKLTSIKFSIEDAAFIERLEHFLIFAGRYPAPKTVKSLLPRNRPDGSWGGLGYYSGSDHSHWKKLITILKTEIKIEV